MRVAQAEKPAFRVPVRAALMAVVAVAFAMVGLAMLAEAMTGGGGTVYLANFSTGSKSRVVAPNLEVVGSGTARGPAESAVVQFLVVRDAPFDDQASASATGTPTTSSSSSSSSSTGWSRGSLSPLINSLMMIGVVEEDVAVLSSPALISVCNNYNRCSSARIDVTVEQPTLDRINEIVNAVGSAANREGMTVQDVGVGYTVSDCTALTRAARELAVADAKKRAGDQAEVLGVALGSLLLSSELAPEAPRDATGCPIVKGGYADSWWTAGSSGLTVPGFDPAAEPEAAVTVQVALAYALGDGDEGS